VPWSVIGQLGTLIDTPVFYNPLSSPDTQDPERVSPLHSQPLVELCLRIPVYIHLRGAVDRGIARRAFSDDLPSAIVRRHWKDRAPNFFEQLLQSNLPLARSLLLDGVLINRRLLDRKKVEQALSGEPSRVNTYATEILDYMFIECWLRSWRTEVACAAA
jgi:asparagine synthase (glutamine-hydrolysing)